MNWNEEELEALHVSELTSADTLSALLRLLQEEKRIAGRLSVDFGAESALDMERSITALHQALKALVQKATIDTGRIKILRSERDLQRQAAVESQSLAEKEEESISNQLLRKIAALNQEKGELMLQTEREEEFLTNNLQKKLTELQADKVKLELELEMEQEFIVNRLTRQISDLKSQQNESGSEIPSASGSATPALSEAVTTHSLDQNQTMHPFQAKFLNLEKDYQIMQLRHQAEVTRLKSEIAAWRRKAEIENNQTANQNTSGSIGLNPNMSNASGSTPSAGHMSRSSSHSRSQTRSRNISLSASTSASGLPQGQVNIAGRPFEVDPEDKRFYPTNK